MSRSIRSLFQQVAEHITAQGIEVDCDFETPLSGRAFTKLKKRSLLPLPPSLVSFYLEEANGVCLSWGTWDGEGEEPEGPFANVEIYPADEVFFDDPEDLDYRPEWEDGYVFDGTDDPELANKTAQSMRSWVRFLGIENGDAICLEASSKPAPVVYDRHDWFDGGDGGNGHLMAPDLFSFLRDWAGVCFQTPESCHWGDVFLEGGGIDWQSDQFDSRYRLDLAD